MTAGCAGSVGVGGGGISLRCGVVLVIMGGATRQQGVLLVSRSRFCWLIVAS